MSYFIAGGITVGISEKISRMLVKQLIITDFWKTLISWSLRGAFMTLSMEALLARASEESRILKYQHPKLYSKLYPIGGDMLYFIFKPVVQYTKEY